jgi:hypothetical protein
MLDAPHTPALAVLRFAKLRTMGKLAVASQHNTRTADSGLSHTTPPPDGPGVVLLDGQADAAAAWHERAAAVGLGKPRRDAVLAVEMVMSASPSWFAAATPDERADWTNRSMEYARATFGPANILQAVRHDDEETPHIHVLAIPLEQKERARAGRPRKGREGAKRTPVLSWGLNADRILGGPEKLREHQSTYAAEMTDLGIRRGRPRRETKAEHKPAAIYRAEAAQDRAEAAKVLEAAHVIEADAERRGKRSQRIERDSRAGADAFTKGLDAVEQGELVAAPRKSFGLDVQPVETPVLPQQMTQEFGGWLSNVRPYLKALVGYAKKLAGLAEREEALKQREAEVARQKAEVARQAEALERVAQRAAWAESARAQPNANRPALDDYRTIAAIPRPVEFADAPGSPSPRERPRGRDRADER